MLRRDFILAFAGALGWRAGGSTQPLTFGMIADPHHGFASNAYPRLEAFLDVASSRRLDFVIQLGDFCHHRNVAGCPFVRLWHGYRGTRYSVLGNHDMDFSTKQAAMDALGMSANYYSFDIRGFHFVVLDCNFLNRGGRFEDFESHNYAGDLIYRDWVNPEQLEWLAADLKSTTLPSIVFTHQPVAEFWRKGASETRRTLQTTIDTATRDGARVIACFSGHEHVDHHQLRNGTHYVLVNSASYVWLGADYGRLADYRDPLFAFVTVNPAGSILLEGRRSEFVPPTPRERNHPEAEFVSASITDRRLRYDP